MSRTQTERIQLDRAWIKIFLFGDLAPIYEIAIREYMLDNDVELSGWGHYLSSLVEIGAHKMSHIRSLEHFCKSKQ